MKKHPDHILASIILIFLILGILVLYSVSAPISLERFGTSFYYLKRQLLLGFLPGIILGFFFYQVPLNSLKKMTPFFFFLNLLFLAMVFLPKIGLEIGGARRWVLLGPISFQPSEFLKISFIMYLGAWLSKSPSEKGKLSEKIRILAFLIIIGLVIVNLIFQPDFSTMAMIVAIGILMFFSGKTPLWATILILLFVFSSFIFLLHFAPYRLARVKVFLNPEIDPLGIGYQLRQSLIAVGSGGTFGLGLGMSHQKLGFLPHPLADSIFSIFAEETGFLGSLIFIFLFLIFFWRGIEISKNCQNNFLKLVALGISSWILLQSFWHIGSLIGILPLTGIPLPFFSYGASHLITELAGMGILLNISKQIS